MKYVLYLVMNFDSVTQVMQLTPHGNLWVMWYGILF